MRRQDQDLSLGIGNERGNERALQLAHLVKMETNTDVMEPSMSPETLVRVGRSLFSIKRPQELHGGPWPWHWPMDCKPRRNATAWQAEHPGGISLISSPYIYARPGEAR